MLRDINGEPVKLSWLPQRTLAIVFWRIGNPEASARTLHAISEVIQVAKYQGINVLWVNLGDSHEGVRDSGGNTVPLDASFWNPSLRSPVSLLPTVSRRPHAFSS